VSAKDVSSKRLRVEVLTFRGDTAVDAVLLHPGQSFWVGPKVGAFRRLKARDIAPRTRLVNFRRNGECTVEFRKNVAGSVQRGQEKINLAGIGSQGYAQKKRGTFVGKIRSGDVLDVRESGHHYHVRYVLAPEELKDKRSLS